MTLIELRNKIDELLIENPTLETDKVYFFDGDKIEYRWIDSIDYEFDCITIDDRIIVLE